ncbi:IgGFc-binding protein-like [Symphorus nematophorus]
MGNLHYTFDGSYYSFMGNCTYTMAKNCHVSGSLPAFEVETKNMNEGNIQVPSVGEIIVNVYGINIDMVRSEFGIVRVNYQQWNLPMNLNNGQVKLFQKGLFVIMETDFGLTVQYDWNEYVAITVPGSFAGSVCGLCGNFNNKKEDDLTTSSGSVASSVAALGASWKVPGSADSAYCQDECVGQCDNCPLTTPKCPENSHYEFCANGCPATCANPNAPTKCNATCVETCVCNDGFLRSGTKCVPRAQCGCVYEGHYVEAGSSFWGGDSCTKRYTCSAGGSLSYKQTSCPTGQQCDVVDGLRGCYPVNYATCMVSGDPHFVTFDGERYNFQGTCAYQLAGVSNQTSLEHFSVVLQNNGQDKKIGSIVKMVEVSVYGYTIVISKEEPGTVLINGELFNLPMMLNNNKLHLYTSGWFAVIETDFGVKVYYDWNSVAFVMVPSTYMGAMQGLCGNYNLNPKDDMQMRDGKQAATSQELGQSWKVATLPGCVDGCSGPCPACNATQRATYSSSSYCGLISDPAGPFRDCHAKVDPAGFLSDCLYDVCLYQGSGNMQCKTLTAYTAACQLKDAQCPSKSQYELCTSSCFRTCQTDATLSLCGSQCMEGFVCDEGYLLSGGKCVPANQCGCISEGKYYQHGQIFYPDALCQKECTCNATVQCKQSSCGPYETCGMKNYIRSCQPLGKGVCSISGDPHYSTFDNTTYDFQGTCTYIAATGCQLSGTRLSDFTVAVENEKCEIVPCTTTCVEGCACDKDYYYNGTGCVPSDQCSCYYNGQTYKVGESIVTEDCHRMHTCQASGVILSKNMTCDPNESCQVKKGVMGCYIQQCFLGANGTLTAFNGDSGTVTMPGAYEIIQSCDQSQTSDWFRVVVKFDMCTPGVNTIVGVFVYFSDMEITVNRKHGIWVNGQVMNQTTFSKSNVNLVVSGNTVKISSASNLLLSISPTNELTMSVSDQVADMVCGVCGKLKPVDTTLLNLRERLLVSLYRPSISLATLNTGQWTAPDFPQW